MGDYMDGQLDVVKYLFAHEDDSVSKHQLGTKLMQYACMRGHFKLVEYLVNNGARINCTDSMGRTPLHHACEFDRFTIFKYLVVKGANVHLRDRIFSRPILHEACFRGHYDMVEYLVGHSTVDVNEQSDSGYTPLHCSSFSDNVQIAKMLIKKGADIHKLSKHALHDGKVATYIRSLQ